MNDTKIIRTAILMLLLHTGIASAELPTLMGSVLGPDVNGFQPGVYMLPTDANPSFELRIPGATALFGGVCKDNVYYATNREFQGGFPLSSVTGYDIFTGKQVYQAQIGIEALSYGMSLDPVTNDVYGIFTINNGETPVIGKADYSSSEPQISVIAKLEGEWCAFSIDSQGTFYGIRTEKNAAYDVTSSTLCRINRYTGKVSEIGETGMLPQYTSGAIIDPDTDTMYWTVCTADEKGFLTRVDLSTGEATVIKEFSGNQQVSGLAFQGTMIPGLAPSAVQDAAVNFEGNSLCGKASFTVPDRCADGTELSGNVTVMILANGKQIYSSSLAPGDYITADVEVPVAGLYGFSFVASNNDGESAKIVKSCYVGPDTPVATTVTLENNNGQALISWLPITHGLNGKPLEHVSYNLVRMPDNVVVASGIEATSFVESLPEVSGFTKIYYVVTAESDGMISDEANSNPIFLGALKTPYYEDFSDGILDGFTIVDSNNDGTEWYMYEGVPCIEVSEEEIPMDDWLITPGISLEAGKSYELTFECYTDETEEILEAYMGNGNMVSDMSREILPATVLDSTIDNPDVFTKMVTVEESGVYFFGFHAISEYEPSFALYISKISVTEGTIANVPSEPSSFNVIPDSDGSLEAVVSLTVPNMNVDGSQLGEIEKLEVIRGTEVIKVYENPQIGETLSFTDVVPSVGYYTYSAVAYSKAGKGATATVSAFIGVDIPSAPKNVRIVYTANPGVVTIQWDAVTTDRESRPLSPGKVTYSLYKIEDSELESIASGLTDTSYTLQAMPEGSQDFVQYSVEAVTAGGESDMSASELLPVGTPYKGIKESGSLTEYVWAATNYGGAEWMKGNDEIVESQDGDNSMIMMFSQYSDQESDLMSGLVSIEDFMNPSISFYTYNIKGDSGIRDINTLTVSVREPGGEYQEIFSKRICDMCEKDNEWCPVNVDLTQFENSILQFKFTGKVVNYKYILIDNLTIGGAGVVSVNEVSDNIRIESSKGGLSIYGANGRTVVVTDINGCVQYYGTINDGDQIDLIKGIYIVRVDTKSNKVIVW